MTTNEFNTDLISCLSSVEMQEEARGKACRDIFNHIDATINLQRRAESLGTEWVLKQLIKRRKALLGLLDEVLS
jgi:hypothetical protein